MKNHELKLPPKAKIDTNIKKKGADLQTPRGIAGLETRVSTKINTNNRHTPRITPTRTGGAVHPILELSLRPYTRRAIPAVKTIVPGMSMGTSFSLENLGRNRQAKTKARQVRMRHTQKMDRQPAGDAIKILANAPNYLILISEECVHASREPIIVPIVDPKGAHTVYIAKALFRSSPSANVRLRMASPFGAF